MVFLSFAFRYFNVIAWQSSDFDVIKDVICSIQFLIKKATLGTEQLLIIIAYAQ